VKKDECCTSNPFKESSVNSSARGSTLGRTRRGRNRKGKGLASKREGMKIKNQQFKREEANWLGRIGGKDRNTAR